jgi:uncharacterized protein (TIGR02466 family)
MSQVTKLFATPVVIDQLPNAEAINKKLEALVRERRNQDKGVALSNRGGWQSTHDFESWGGDIGRMLFDHAGKLATSVTTGGGPGHQWTIDGWANISGPGNSNALHIHGGSYFSCVYYVKVGEKGGALILHDPRMPGLRMHAPGLRFKNGGPEIKAEIQPQAGMMVLFPAWLGHSVEPWEGEGDRISIAMNIRSAPWAPKLRKLQKSGQGK